MNDWELDVLSLHRKQISDLQNVIIELGRKQQALEERYYRDREEVWEMIKELKFVK